MRPMLRKPKKKKFKSSLHCFMKGLSSTVNSVSLGKGELATFPASLLLGFDILLVSGNSPLKAVIAHLQA